MNESELETWIDLIYQIYLNNETDQVLTGLERFLTQASRIRFDESKKDQVFTRFDYNEIGYGIFNAYNYLKIEAKICPYSFTKIGLN